MKLKPNARFYDVRFSQPTEKTYNDNGTERKYSYKENIHVMIVAESVKDVVVLVESAYPNGTIHQINHRGGECPIIIQTSVAE